jgi:hypothetical protein
MVGTSYFFSLHVQLGCTSLAIQTLVLIFLRALPTLFLGVLSTLLPARLALSMLTGLAALSLSTLLTVFLHFVCH